MSRARGGVGERSAVDLVEEAVWLLRTAPSGLLARYYAGSIPFVLGFLFFWADMSRSAFASAHLAETALGLALLFVWMKAWQTLFCAGLRAHLRGEQRPAAAPTEWLRCAVAQGIVQPCSLLVLPVALLLAVPFGWVYAFFQNLTCLGETERIQVRALVRDAGRQAALWPAQNHVLIFFLSLFGALVFLNLAAALFWVPRLLKSILGLETVFTRNPLSLVNSTTLTALFGVGYLCADPLVKSAYALRCFYGRSLRSGEDLKTDWRSARTTAGVALFVVCCVLWGAPRTVGAEERGTESPAVASEGGAPGFAVKGDPAGSTRAEALDRSIVEVMSRREYAWRMGRDKGAAAGEGEGGVIGGFLKDSFAWLERAVRAVERWWDALFSDPPTGRMEGTGWSGWIGSPQAILAILGALAVCTLAVVLLRRRRTPEGAAEAEPGAVAAELSLEDEAVMPDQLTPDGWTAMARDLLARGETRLALRALYLASLACLAERELIAIAKHKSNRDYVRELARRAHALPDVSDAFSQNVGQFDRVWYGTTRVDRDLLDQYTRNQRRIMARGAG